MDTTLEDLKTAILAYFDALERSDAALIGSLFHEKALYAATTGGDIRFWSMDHYLPIVAGRPSFAAEGKTHDGRILSISLAGDAAACAMVQMTLMGRHFTDILSFVRQEGQWKIAAKVFDSVPVL